MFPKMKKRHALLGLIIFVSVTIVTMVLRCQYMTTFKVKALRLFARQRELAPQVSTNSTPLLHLSTPIHRGSPPSTHNSTSAKIATTTSTTTTTTTTTTTITTTTTEAKPVPPKPAAQPTNRPLRCQNCFKVTMANLTAVPEVCGAAAQSSGSAGNGRTTPEMLMLITTALDGLDRRQAIRDTWASVTQGNTAAHVRHVFLLGTDRQGKVSPEILAEAVRYKDILVSDFVDVYGNLTYKTLAGLHYLVDHCAQAKYFMKTDQDMYVFPERILGLARQNEGALQTSIGGACYQTGKPWRDPNTKYYASIQSYPQPTYPGFCSGTGYIGSLNVARKILDASPDIPFFHLEDVYLALVIRHLGYRLVRYEGFVEGAEACGRGSRGGRKVMTIHEVSAEKIRELWANKCDV